MNDLTPLNIQPGTQLLYYTGGTSYASVDALTVERLTKTRLITDAGQFTIKTGEAYPRGSVHSRCWIPSDQGGVIKAKYYTQCIRNVVYDLERGVNKGIHDIIPLADLKAIYEDLLQVAERVDEKINPNLK